VQNRGVLVVLQEVRLAVLQFLLDIGNGLPDDLP
jgi:hypothetical protein